MKGVGSGDFSVSLRGQVFRVWGAGFLLKATSHDLAPGGGSYRA